MSGSSWFLFPVYIHIYIYICRLTFELLPQLWRKKEEYRVCCIIQKGFSSFRLYYFLMGGKSSKDWSERQFSHSGSTASSWNQHGYSEPSHLPQHRYAPSPSFNGVSQPVRVPQQRRTWHKSYSRIADNYCSLDEVFVLPCFQHIHI